MGRVVADERKTNGVTKTTSYAYNLDGTLKTLTYPSGRVLSYQVDGAELPLQAADTTTTYAASASYAPQRVHTFSGPFTSPSKYEYTMTYGP